MEKKDFIILTDAKVDNILKERMIRIEELAEVLRVAGENKSIVLDKSTGESVASCMIGNVTFWVRYKLTEKGYEIRSAYSHRMRITPLI